MRRLGGPGRRRRPARIRAISLVLVASVLVVTACSDSDGSASSTTSEAGTTPQAGDPSWLFVLKAAGGEVEPGQDGHLAVTLTGLDPTVIGFTDRPDRETGHEAVESFAQRWEERFADDPPNAALVATDAGGADETAVVTIETFTLSDPTTARLEMSVVTEPTAIADDSALEALVANDDPDHPLGTTLTGVALFVDDAAVGPDMTGPTASSPTASGEADGSATTTTIPRSTTPHLDAVQAKLRTTNPTSEGIAWSRSSGNALLPRNGQADGWLLQTPQCWGLTTCTTDSFTRFTSTLAEITAQATTVVDLTTLYPFPDGGFRQGLVDGLAQSFKAGNRPLIRVTAGVPPTYSINGITPGQWMQAFVADIAAGSGVDPAVIPVSIASVATSWGWSWNHAKIVAVDGRDAVIGGHNLWAGDYLQLTNPIDDVSLHHQGPVVAESHDFVDNEWGFICKNLGWTGRLNVSYAATAAVSSCPAAHPPLPAVPAPGSVEMLSIGRLGMGIADKAVDGGPLPTDLVSYWDAAAVACSPITNDYTNRGAPYERSNPGEPALRALISSAQESVTITQQDMIGMCYTQVVPRWDVRVFDALADRIANGVTVNIVISTPGTPGYTNDGTLADISGYLLSRVQAKVGDAAKAKQLFCAQVGVAPLRFNDSMDTWPNGSPIGNHTKVVAVDRAAFYVGSQNLYPAWLQEYGVITEDAAAAATFYEDLLDPMWQHSQRAEDTSQCPA